MWRCHDKGKDYDTVLYKVGCAPMDFISLVLVIWPGAEEDQFVQRSGIDSLLPANLSIMWTARSILY